MKPIEVTVNQRRHRKLVVPRTSLADFLRDEIGLTGTHLGCEHGICGACTVLIDGQMSRSCITYAISCDGATVETIEGLDDDPVMKELRRAFSEEHALQCGYCTPGMLITARDILSRYKTPTTVQIRHELSGNLCRCTGYRGIVRAIARVAELPVTGVHPEHAPGLGPAPGPQAGSAQTESTAGDVVTQDSTAMPVMQSAAAAPSDIAVNVSETTLSDGWVSIAQTFTLPHPRTEVWPLISNLEDVCSALPGIELDGPPVDGVVSGNASISLGPIRPVFAFSGSHTVDTEGYTSALEGTGSDRRTNSRVKARIQNRLIDLEQKETRVEVEITYTIVGPLAQFGRSGFVRNLIGRMASAFARNVNTTLSGDLPNSDPPLGFWSQVSKWLNSLFGISRRKQH